MDGRLTVGAFVPTVRPAMLGRLLESWRRTSSVAGIGLFVHAQREPQYEFRRLLGREVAGFTYERHGGPVFPMRVRAMLAHPDIDVWINLDDDMELLPGMTDWRPAIARVTEPGVGVVSCNWARTEAMIKHRWPPKEPVWVQQPIVNMAGGQVYGRRIVALLAEDVQPYLFDDVQVGLTAYLAGYVNFRFRGSVLIHRILAAGGLKTVFSARDWPKPDPRYVLTRRSTPFYPNAPGNDVMMPGSGDLLPAAHMRHRDARAALLA